MKKSELKALAKAARKTVTENIETTLVAELNKVTAGLGKASKDLTKAIQKGSKQLAKKIAKEIKTEVPAAIAVVDSTPAAKAKKPVTAAKVKTAKPAKAVAPSKPVKAGGGKATKPVAEK